MRIPNFDGSIFDSIQPAIAIFLVHLPHLFNQLTRPSPLFAPESAD